MYTKYLNNHKIKHTNTDEDSSVLHETGSSSEWGSLYTSTGKRTHPTPCSLLTDFSTRAKSHAYATAACVSLPAKPLRTAEQISLHFPPNSLFCFPLADASCSCTTLWGRTAFQQQSVSRHTYGLFINLYSRYSKV